LSVTVFETITGLQTWLRDLRTAGLKVGFVPTMGALHDGHISLINSGKEVCDVLVVSIFVNPTQFNNPDDLAKYPRTFDADLALLEKSGASALFFPSVDEMYPKPEKNHWDFGLLSTSLEGHFRPGHFDGMLTVVKKLLQIVSPESAFFGEKDFQQLALIRRMVLEEGLDVKIIGCPIIRENDGLAMSSRNTRLSAEGRIHALAISRILFSMREQAVIVSPAELLSWGNDALRSSEGIELEYLSIVNARTFERVDGWSTEDDAVVLVAAYVDGVRLIDNVVIKKILVAMA
jgi:pantoate--beta-alanine ligase